MQVHAVALTTMSRVLLCSIAELNETMLGTQSLAHLSVHDVCNGVDKLHDVFLEHLSGVGEVADVTEAKDGHHFVSWHHGIQVTPAPRRKRQAKEHHLGTD